MHILKKALIPFTLGIAAVTLFTGCNVRFSAGHTRYYHDRVWYGDPYCRYSWDYGCSYGDSGYRVRFMFGRRHHGHWRRHHNVEAMTLASAAAERPTTWQKEFNMSDRAVSTLNAAFESALKGKTDSLRALGLENIDMARLADFKMPSNVAIARAAKALGMKANDTRDFIELYLVRLEAALEEGRK